MGKKKNKVVKLPEGTEEGVALSPEEQAEFQRQVQRQNRNNLRQLGFDFNTTYYISGPMSGYQNYNYETFATVANVLRAAGLDVESPHENPWPADHASMDPKQLWEEMMKLCRTQMKSCGGIILLKGWPQSTGARQELRYAIMQGWPVWFFDPENGNMVNMNKNEELVIPQGPEGSEVTDE